MKFRSIYHFLTAMLMVLWAVPSMAQSLVAKGPSQVSAGQRFQVSWTLNGNATTFEAPNLSAFQLLGGPNQSQSVQIVNGSMSQSITYSYVLVAPKEGEYTIAPAKMVLENGRAITSDRITIQVSKAGQAQPQQQASQGGTTSSEQSNADIFARIEVTKRKVDRGEELMATCGIYARSNVVNLENWKFPDYQGFWTKDIDVGQQIRFENEVVNGVMYQVGTLKKTILYPQKAGKLEISPLSIDVIVREKASGNSNNIFDQFFGSYQDVRKSIASPAVTIEVRDLPEEGRPDGFSGLTGQFKLDVSMDRQNARANDAINLKVSISGSGNLLQVQNPEFQLPPDIEAYDPKVNDNIKADTKGINGSRFFEYVLIPRYAGDFEIGPFNFSYFDPTTHKYVNLTKPAFKLHIDKGAAGDQESATSSIAIADKEEIKKIGSDIRYIKQGQYQLESATKVFYRSGLFYALLVIPALIGGAVVAFSGHHRRQNSDASMVRSRKARKMALQRLQEAKKLLDSGKDSAFHEELTKALTLYVSHRFHIPMAELNMERMSEVFAQRNVPQQVADEFISTFEKAEFARYAPGMGQSMQQGFQMATDAIVKLENHA